MDDVLDFPGAESFRITIPLPPFLVAELDNPATREQTIAGLVEIVRQSADKIVRDGIAQRDAANPTE